MTRTMISAVGWLAAVVYNWILMTTEPPDLPATTGAPTRRAAQGGKAASRLVDVAGA